MLNNRSVLKTVMLLLVTFTLMLLYQNCSDLGPEFEVIASINSSSSHPSTDKSVFAFSETLYPVIQQRCASCHGSFQVPAFAVEDVTTSHDLLITNFLVDLQSPQDSRVVQKILEGHNNFDPSWADDLEQAIYIWSAALREGTEEVDPGDSTPSPDLATPSPSQPEEPPVQNTKATYKWISSNVLNSRCVSCHGPSQAARGVRYDTYAFTMDTVAPGDPYQSFLWSEINFGSMPLGGLHVTAEELQAISDWIKAGALNN